MKVRSVLCALAAAAAATVFADVTSNVCGLLKITSDLKNTIIGVPWVEVGTTPDADIKVAKLVKTDNLTAGDMLYYYNAGTWNAWTLGADGWGPNTTGTVDGKTVAAADCLVPGVGEIIGGSQREERLDVLEARMDELGLNKEDLLKPELPTNLKCF